jgi:acetolactate synthase regulatory subunit
MKYHFVTETLNNGVIDLQYVGTKDQLGEQLFNKLLIHERRYGFHVFRMASSTNSDSDEVTTEYVLAGFGQTVLALQNHTTVSCVSVSNGK